MTNKIDHLNNLYQLHQRLMSAMARRVMVEAGRRACVKGPKALEKIIDNALRQAADLYPLSVRVTLSRLLDRDPATLKLIQCEREELQEYVRQWVFQKNPGLEPEVKKAERFLETPEILLPAEKNFLLAVRNKVLKLKIDKDLRGWELIGKSEQEVIESCFPFVEDPYFARLEEIHCENVADLRKAYANLKAGLKIKDEQELFKNLNKKFGEPCQLRYSLRDVLNNFERIFYANWQVGRRLQRMNRELSSEQLLDLFLKFVVHPERSKKEIAKDLHRIRETLGYINETAVKINCIWVTRYGLEVFSDLFGMNCVDYLKSKLFWNAKKA